VTTGAFYWLGLALVFALGFVQGTITPSSIFRVLTMLIVPFPVGFALASSDPFSFIGLMFFVPPGIVLAGFGSLLGELFRRRTRSSPLGSHPRSSQASPSLPDNQNTAAASNSNDRHP